MANPTCVWYTNGIAVITGCCGNHCWLAIMLWFGYCLFSFESFVLSGIIGKLLIFQLFEFFHRLKERRDEKQTYRIITMQQATSINSWKLLPSCVKMESRSSLTILTSSKRIIRLYCYVFFLFP